LTVVALQMTEGKIPTAGTVTVPVPLIHVFVSLSSPSSLVTIADFVSPEVVACYKWSEDKFR